MQFVLDGMLLKTHRIALLPVTCPAVSAVAEAVMLSVKNIYNTTLFLARNLLTAYDWDAASRTLRLKTELHQHQRDLIATLNTVVADFNVYWADKAAGVLDEEGVPKKSKQLALLEPVIPSATLNRLVTHPNVMERLFKAYQAGTGYDDYRVLPGRCSASLSSRPRRPTPPKLRLWITTRCRPMVRKRVRKPIQAVVTAGCISP